jgi:hypothetical protein
MLHRYSLRHVATRCQGLLLALVLSAVGAYGQGISVSGQAIVNTPVSAVPGITAVLQAIPNAIITVCTAAGGGLPCSPTQNIYKDSALTVLVSNPLALCVGAVNGCIDLNGNFQFWIAVNSTGYIYSQTGPGVTGAIFIIGGQSNTMISPSLSSPTITGTVAGGASYMAPTLTNPTSTGTDTGTETLTNKTLTSPVLTSPTIATGVNNNGSGLKHVRVSGCTTAAGANSTCNTTVTWGTAFADGNYTMTCMLDNAGVAGAYVSQSASRVGASVVVQIDNGAGGGAITGTIHCIAVHD